MSTRSRLLHAAGALACAAALLGGATGCATSRTVYDYGPFMARMPRSILVLPPLDETPEVEACYGYLATVTFALAERGYYVFPVAVVDRMMRENGLPTAGEMHQVPLAKLHEVFGADAVLYLVVKQWGSSYQVLSSVTTVSIEGRLVDARTGDVLWEGAETAEQRSGGGESGIVGMLVGAVFEQVTSSATDRSPGLARSANQLMFEDPYDGLLLGPYHPSQAADVDARRAAMAKQKEQPVKPPAKAKTTGGD